jgi:hypothetical protein
MTGQCLTAVVPTTQGILTKNSQTPFLTMVETMLQAQETAQTKLQTLVDGRLSKYGQSDPADYLKVRGRFRKHPGDRDRENAVKANEDRAKMLALMFRDLCKLGGIPTISLLKHITRWKSKTAGIPKTPGSMGGSSASLLSCRSPMRFVK